MSVFSSVLVCSSAIPTIVSGLAATTSSAEVDLGNNCIFAINATQDITIAWGVTGMNAATANNFRIPANSTITMDTGNSSKIRVYNLGASSATIYIQPFSKF